MSDAPERIWIDDQPNEGFWHEGLPRKGTRFVVGEYVRADLYDAVKAERDEYKSLFITPTPAAKWRLNGEPDPHGTRYDCTREELAGGQFSDDAVANGQYMCSGNIAWQTTAKDRIRWLSRQLEASLARKPFSDDERFMPVARKVMDVFDNPVVVRGALGKLSPDMCEKMGMSPEETFAVEAIWHLFEGDDFYTDIKDAAVRKPKAKALVWTTSGQDKRIGIVARAPSQTRQPEYLIVTHGHEFCFWVDGFQHSGKFGSADEAKAAAQAHHDDAFQAQWSGAWE